MAQDGGYGTPMTGAGLPMSPVEQLQAMPAVPPKPTTHDVTIITTRKLAQAKVLGVPPEEFGIERSARDIKTANYAFHEVVTKTEADLIAEGFDERQVKALSDYNGTSDIETLSRNNAGEQFTGSSSTNTSARPVRITEHYIRMDYEGNGKPCLYMVVTGGDQGEILKKDGKEVIKPIDVIPLACTTPVPVTHRFFGRSMADLVMQIQREKTALKRGALDNLYLHNNPRVEVSEVNASPNTLDDLLVSRPGGVVRTKTPGGLNWQVVPDITTSIYPMLQYLDAELETRTGVTRQGQGIDANALQNQSATAVAQVFSASQMRMKLIARIMAEGVRDIFALLHHTIRTHGSEQKQTIRLRNQWVDVDPRNWKTRDDMTINVGLGNGSKAQQFAQIMALGNAQKELIAGGMAQMVPPDKLFATASELTKLMGYKNPDRFFGDPSEKNADGKPKYPPLPPQPSPEQVKVEGQLKIEQMKADHGMQQAGVKSQQDKDKAELDLFHQKLKFESESQLAKEKAQLEREQALIDAAIKEREDQRKAELHALEMEQKRQTHAHTMAANEQQHGQTIQTKQLEHHNAATKTASVDQIGKLHDALAEHAKKVEENANAPVVIIRDAKTGKASEIHKGTKRMIVQRGKDGKAEKLQ